MLVTETTPFQGSRVRFPVKALRFFSEFFQRKVPWTTASRRVFLRNFPSVKFRVFPCLTGANLGECEAVVRAKQKGVDNVGHSDAIGRERRPYRRGTGSLNKDLFRSGLHWNTDPMPYVKGREGWLNQLGAGLKYDLQRRCLPVR